MEGNRFEDTDFLPDSNEILQLYQKPGIIEFVEGHFASFVGSALLCRFQWNGSDLEMDHKNRAIILGGNFADSHQDWKKWLSMNGLDERARRPLSVLIARLIVGHELPFIDKIQSLIRVDDASRLPMDQLYAAIQVNIVFEDCGLVDDLWNAIESRYDLGT